jgi:hypothetical protein
MCPFANLFCEGTFFVYNGNVATDVIQECAVKPLKETACLILLSEEQCNFDPGLRKLLCDGQRELRHNILGASDLEGVRQ